MFQSRKKSNNIPFACINRFWHMAGCLTAVIMMCGCGHGGLGIPFTGGGFPTGLNTRMSGRVVRADNSLQPLANASITLTVSTTRYVLAQFQATSAADGSFSFPAIPTGENSVTADIDIVTTDISVQEQKIKFAVSHDQPVQLIAAVPPAGFNINQAASVTVTLSKAIVPIEMNIPFVTKVLDNQGNTIALMPSLLFYGGFGSVGIDNTFYANSSGKGQIIAVWNSSIHSEASNITADSTLKQDVTPPAAP